jgi:predicted GH43/DUF377 family glycosyl hydrolase
MVSRTTVLLAPDPSRVMIRFFWPGSVDRAERVIARITALSDGAVRKQLRATRKRFEDRHHDIGAVLHKHYRSVVPYLSTDIEPSEERKLLIGAYFTSEYALESAALFNPSIVPHPDQSGLPEGSLRFIMSLRATGEGHVSSLEFREGVIDADHRIILTPPGDMVTGPDRVENPTYEKDIFARKLREIGFWNETAEQVLGGLGREFELGELKQHIADLRQREHLLSRAAIETLDAIRTVAEENYDVRFSCNCPISERVVFPRVGYAHHSIEDARFVRFQEGNDSRVRHRFFATYTAFDGHIFLPKLLETEDFTTFRFVTLNGPGVENKGMALFPRKIRGRYAMLSRQDGENIFLMYSDNIHFWYDRITLMKPSYPWEYVQLGNCGSPIETDAGWLVLTHGVGPMRRYCIGAVLLDKANPEKLIGRLTDPLLEPTENERDGYVPNVVYTCGALVHRKKLVLPYGVADYATRIAIVDLDELLERLLKKPD